MLGHRSSLGFLLAAGFLFVLLLGGCQRAADPQSQGEDRGEQRYTIVTTTSIIADSARRIVGDRARVVALIGEGVDPHLFKPTRADVARLMEADIILYNGLMLEGRMGDVLHRLSSERPVLAVAEKVDPTILLAAGPGEETYDPHLWMDVVAWNSVVSNLVDALSEFDPLGEEQYRSNHAVYQRELEDLDGYVREALATLPPGAAILVTAHDAFRYFGRTYEIEVVGIQGLSTDSEAGLDDLNKLVDLLVARSIPAVFVETSVADKNVRALIEGAAARGVQVEIGGELFSDSLGGAGTYEGTYVGMIDHNVTTLVRALGGVAPERGFRGRLGGGQD